MRYLLDTDTVSYFLRDKFGVATRILAADPDDLAISRVSIAELWVQARTARFGRINPSSLGKFVRALRGLPVTEVIWDHFATTRAAMIRSGRDFGVTGNFDVLIGCTAALHGLIVVTNNERHFRPLGELLGTRIENWVEPPATE